MKIQNFRKINFNIFYIIRGLRCASRFFGTWWEGFRVPVFAYQYLAYVLSSTEYEVTCDKPRRIQTGPGK